MKRIVSDTEMKRAGFKCPSTLESEVRMAMLSDLSSEEKTKKLTKIMNETEVLSDSPRFGLGRNRYWHTYKIAAHLINQIDRADESRRFGEVAKLAKKLIDEVGREETLFQKARGVVNVTVGSKTMTAEQKIEALVEIRDQLRVTTINVRGTIKKYQAWHAARYCTRHIGKLEDRIGSAAG